MYTMKKFLFLPLFMVLFASCSGQQGQKSGITDASTNPQYEIVKLFYSYLMDTSTVSESEFYSVFGKLHWAGAEDYLKKINNQECFLTEDDCPSYIFAQVKLEFKDNLIGSIVNKSDIDKLLWPSLDDPEIFELRFENDEKLLFLFRKESGLLYIEDVILNDGRYIFEDFEE